MTFFVSFWDALNGMAKKDQLPVFRAVVSYGLFGEHSEALTPTQNAFFSLMQPVLDSSRKKAANRKQNGNKTKTKQQQKGEEKEIENESEYELESENECYIMAQTVVCLPLNDGTEFPVTEEMVSEFSSLYQAVDVVQALRNMRGWLLSNPKNRKTSSGIRRFMNSWLSREQDRARPQKSQQPAYTHGSDRLAAMIEGGAFDD
jgi:hypothetical protein